MLRNDAATTSSSFDASIQHSRREAVRRLLHRADDLLGHLLGVAEQHHGVVVVEQAVLDAGIARGGRALDEERGPRMSALIGCK